MQQVSSQDSKHCTRSVPMYVCRKPFLSNTSCAFLFWVFEVWAVLCAHDPISFCSQWEETLFPWCIKFFGWFPRMLSFFPPCKENCKAMTWLRVIASDQHGNLYVFKCFNQRQPHLGHQKIQQPRIYSTWVPASASLVIPLLGLVSPPSPWL